MTPPRAVSFDTEALLAETRAIRRLQEQALALLQATTVRAPAPGPVPSRHKRVLLVDDDPASLEAARAALDAAQISVRTATEGNAALAAIAGERPDVIVIELELGGAMPGKDVINMLRATMEWVDIPVVLYTRTAITSHADARAVHGGDEFVPKTAGAEALVTTIGSLLCR